MTKAKLNMGDIPLIAEKLGTSARQIRFVLSGDRGKRGTKLQDNIKEAVELRTKQNEELDRFCKRVRVERVVPTKVNK